MKLSIYISCLALITIVSCSKKMGSGKEVVDEDKMANIMYDVLLAESYVESYLMKDTALSKDSLLKVEMNKVLKVHGISSATFKESYLYYKTHPLQLEKVLDSAHERAARGRTDVFIRRRPVKNR